MTSSIVYGIVFIIAMILEGIVVWKASQYFSDRWWKGHFKDIKEEIEEKFRKGSARVIRGQIKESFAPFTEKWKWSLVEAHFLGQPIDLIVFDKLEKGEVPTIVLVEIKTGNAQQTVREKLVEAAVHQKKIEYHVLRI